MRVIIVNDKAEMGVRAAHLVAEDMNRKTGPYVLGLATGSTPLTMYNEWIRMHKDDGLDFSTCISFNLDEYVGLPGTHDQSYRYFMNTNLFDKVNINKKNTFVPDGLAKDIDAFCEHYEAMIDDVGGIDYQVLGIGGNGHIGFNEPGSSLGSLTRIKTLTERTITDNARFFAKLADVPTQAITMGIGTVFKARRVVLLANGENKADAIKAALEGPVTSLCPASALQLHRWATCVIDKAAASKLTLQYEA